MMEERESILEAIQEDDGFEDYEDVEMADVEEGEFVEENLQPNSGQSKSVDAVDGNQPYESNKCKKKKNKKRKKKKQTGGTAPEVMDINRFVLQTCRCLKEKKSYMVYTAVGCLGVSALTNILKEVDAVQACGGQMTADGRRSRSGGGILWNIIKTRDPNAYKEIMKKTKEFEKQFRQQNMKVSEHNKEASSQINANASSNGTTASVSEGTLSTPQNEHQQPPVEGNRKSVHDRIRAPVSYDDLLGDDPKDKPS